MTSLTIVRKLKASPDRVFSAFTDPKKIAVWWGPDAGPVIEAKVDPRKGGRYQVRFRMQDGSEHSSSGVFETFEPPHHLVMSWTWEDEAGLTSQVEVTLREIDEGTELSFTHSKLRDDAARDSHEDGWNGALDKLELRAGEL